MITTFILINTHIPTNAYAPDLEKKLMIIIAAPLALESLIIHSFSLIYLKVDFHFKI